MVHLAIICGVVAIVFATISLVLLVIRFRQLTDPVQVERLKGLIARGGVSDAEPNPRSHGRLRNVLWLVTSVLGKPFVPFVTWDQRRRLRLLLDRAGLSDWNFSQIYFSQCLSTVCSVLLAMWLLEASLFSGELSAYIALLIFAALGWWLPRLLLRRCHQQRAQRMNRQLPFFLDMVGLGLDAGLNLQASIQLALEHIGTGTLHQEWSIMLADMRAGQPRVQALRQLSMRLNIPAIRQLISSLIQGESMGFSLGRIIQVYADQQRAQRLMQAEKLALQAPVKMLFPMAVCIFPCTFIVLGFPVVVQLLGLS